MMRRRATVDFDEERHRALRVKAAGTERSVSGLGNETDRRSLAEDFEELSAFADRVEEPNLSFGAVAKDLKRDGRT